MATVTFLLVDQAGSTSQLATLGDDDAAPVRQRLFELLHSSLADHEGREIDNTGDGLLACFDSAVSAIAMRRRHAAACVAAQRRGRRRRAAPPPGRDPYRRAGRRRRRSSTSAWRSSIAARLCAVAQSDQVLTTDLVKALVGSRHIASFAEVGEQVLKGVEEPVSIWQVDWERPAPHESAMPPLPARLVPQRPVAIRRTARGASPADGSLEVRGGGRTASSSCSPANPASARRGSAAEVAKDANAGGATVLFGHCDEDLGIPYQPFVEAVRDLLRDLPTDLLAAHVEAHGGELGRLVPDLHRRAPGRARRRSPPSPRPSGSGCSRRSTGLLALAARSNPLVLVLDDLHWASKPTILLLRRLAEESNPLPLLVVGTYRSSDISAEHPLFDTLADLHREADVTRLALDGLSDDGVIEFMVALAGHDLDDDAVGLRAHAAAGDARQPVLRRRAAASPRRRPAPSCSATAVWTTDVDLETVVLPDSVRGVVGRRIHRLSAERTTGAQRRRGHRPGVRPGDVEHRARARPRTSSSTRWRRP